MKQSELKRYRARVAEFLERQGMVVSAAERGSIEIADFGLGEFERTGLGIVVYVNTSRCCAKELVMFPRQTCPEHLHPAVGTDPGKEETFRCRYGKVYLYVEGPPASRLKATPPAGSEAYYVVRKEIELNPGDQYTIMPNIRHWFQAGEAGAIVSEFSTTSRDELDIFTDPRIIRQPDVEADL